ncbi:DUF1232 domain-containing protein [Paenibacillus sp. 2KB_20]|uniref:helix-turn-helix domain-containing protein n=1 Tax=Paenibacillus sp. 2KB_20 TaxID=3232977 RepID=UPI003F9D6075
MEENTLGLILTRRLQECGISMRKLASLTNVDPATISRIINGKTRPKEQLLDQIAFHLELDPLTLFVAAGYGQDELKQFYKSIEKMVRVLLSSTTINWVATTEKIESTLAEYREFSKTPEGERIIQTELKAKLQRINGQGPFIEKIEQMHEQYLNNSLSPEASPIIGSALLYFILEKDIIPDNLFPLGFIDDALAIQLALDQIIAME